MAEFGLPRLASVAGRATLVWSDSYGDVERISSGRFGSDPQEALRTWDRFEDWARSVEPETPGLPQPRLLGPPVPCPSQVFAVGLNYREHVAEAGYDTSGLPQVFTKFPSCLASPFSTVAVTSPRLDWEVELVVVMGRTGRNIDEADAWSSIAGLMIGQDLSARDVQLAGAAPQWSLGKSFKGFGPIGPWITLASELANRDDLMIECDLNGELVQRDRTSNMIWSVAELVARISSVCELVAGDLIFTGTPSGVGNRRQPPVFISPGDRLTSRIEGLGEMINNFVSPGLDADG